MNYVLWGRNAQVMDDDHSTSSRWRSCSFLFRLWMYEPWLTKAGGQIHRIGNHSLIYKPQWDRKIFIERNELSNLLRFLCSATEKEPVCHDLQKILYTCYRKNPEKTLRCYDEARCYINCVNQTASVSKIKKPRCTCIGQSKRV